MKFDYNIVLAGLVHLFFSVLIGVFFIYLAYTLFKKLNSAIDDDKELKNGNISVAVLMGSVIFSIVWITRGSVISGMDTISTLFRSGFILKNTLIAIGIFVLQILVSGILSIITIWISTLLFTLLTKNFDEFKEIKNNNLAIALVLGVVVISLALFVEPAINVILNGLVPYPVLDIAPKLPG